MVLVPNCIPKAELRNVFLLVGATSTSHNIGPTGHIDRWHGIGKSAAEDFNYDRLHRATESPSAGSNRFLLLTDRSQFLTSDRSQPPLVHRPAPLAS